MASKEGLSHARVLVDCEYSVKKYLKMEKVIPALVERKAVPKKFGKQFLKKNDAELFIGFLKQMSFEKFGIFLEVLQSLQAEDDHKHLMKVLSSSLKQVKVKDPKAQHIFSSFIETADREETWSDVEHQTVISDTIEATQGETKLSESTVQTNVQESDTISESTVRTDVQESDTVSESTDVQGTDTTTLTQDVPSTAAKHQEELTEALLSSSVESSLKLQSDDTVQESPISIPGNNPPPAGYIKPNTSMEFTVEGGMLYSPVHGVIVEIPPGAVPHNLQGGRFRLGIYAYLGGPFALPSDVEACSAVIWFYMYPSFVFQADVTVTIPHAVVLGEAQECREESGLELCIYTMPTGGEQEEGVFKLTECINGDFEDEYHAVFKVRHFSPFLVGKKDASSKKSGEKGPGIKSRSLQKRSSSKDMQPRLRSLSSRSASIGNSSQGSFDDSYNSSPQPTRSFFLNDPTVEVNDSLFVSHVRESANHTSTDTQSHLEQPSSSDSHTSSNTLSGPSNHSESIITSNKVAQSTNIHPPSVPNTVGALRYIIARCMARDRSVQNWNVTFVLNLEVPTAHKVIELYCNKEYIHGYDICPKVILFTEDSNNTLTLSPDEWASPDGVWCVSANETPELSSYDILPTDPSLMNPNKDFLPKIIYTISALKFPPVSQLKCRLDVRGAVLPSGNALFFRLHNNFPPSMKGVNINTVFTRLYLYGTSSDITSALRQQSPDFKFDLQNSEHIKFLADISFQLRCVGIDKLAEELHLEPHLTAAIKNDYQSSLAEQTYQILRNWVAGSRGTAHFSDLKLMLRRVGFENIHLLHDADIMSEGEGETLLDPRLDSLSIPRPEDNPKVHKFLSELSVKSQRCWRSIGRMMGISENRIDEALVKDRLKKEQSYHMLYEWQRREGNNAKFGTLFKAVQRVMDHDPDKVNDAWCYCIRKVDS